MPLRPPAVVDEPDDLFGVEPTAAGLAARVEGRRARQRRAETAPGSEHGRSRLSPAFTAERDRVDGPPWARSTVVVFGAYATPSSSALGGLLAQLHERRREAPRVVWRHFPDPGAHPRSVVFALAAEAAATRGRFWVLTRRMLDLRHHDPEDLHAAVLDAGLDPATMLETVRSGSGTERILEDADSALASGVTSPPALFVDGERYDGKLEVVPICSAIDARGGFTRTG